MKRRNTLATEQTHERRRAIYGLDKTAVEAMAERQGSACPICTQPLDFERSHGLHVDHCHNRNVVRGLLCAGCNTLLGRWEAIASWRTLNADRIDSYLVENENLPMPVKGKGKRGPKPRTFSEAEIKERLAKKRASKPQWARKTREISNEKKSAEPKAPQRVFYESVFTGGFLTFVDISECLLARGWRITYSSDGSDTYRLVLDNDIIVMFHRPLGVAEGIVTVRCTDNEIPCVLNSQFASFVPPDITSPAKYLDLTSLHASRWLRR